MVSLVPPTSDAPAPGNRLRWDADALWGALQPLLPDVSIEIVARTDSTNTRLVERARSSGGRRDLAADDRAPYGRRAGDTAPCLLVAEYQGAGRGRLGREWRGAAAASLTFSLSLPLAPRDWSGLSLAVGVALADALDATPGAPRIGLKWPNDLWLLDGPGRGRKLGGILIETVPVAQQRMCVVGIGLNVLPQPAEGLAHGYACLQELDADAGAPKALHAVAAPLVRALRRFEAEGFAPFAAAWARRDLLAGQPVTTTGEPPLQGTADGVDERGALRVVADGTVHALSSGEISVRLRDGAC